MRFMLLLAVLCMSGCATSVIDYKSGTDFSVYQHASVRKDNDQKDTSIDAARIHTSLEKYLPEQGLIVATTGAQLEVVGRLVEYRRYESNQMSWGFGGARDSLALGLAAPISADERKQYRLEIEFVDIASKQVIWKARSTQAMDENYAAGKREKWIDQNVARMLMRYPPK